jgi:hypothetical protein
MSSSQKPHLDGLLDVDNAPEFLNSQTITNSSSSPTQSFHVNLHGLKRHNTESDIDTYICSNPNTFGLRISAPSDEHLQKILIQKRSDKEGKALMEAHESAKNDMSPSFVYPEGTALRGPHFPKIKKSLSWSCRGDMSDEIIASIKEFNKNSPVSRELSSQNVDSGETERS